MGAAGARSGGLGEFTGAGGLIGVGRLHSLTGTEGGRGGVATGVLAWLAGLEGVNTTALAVAVATAVMVVLLRLLGGRFPGELIALVVATAASIGLVMRSCPHAEQLGVGERMVKKYMAQALLHCAILEAELDGMLVQ